MKPEILLIVMASFVMGYHFNNLVNSEQSEPKRPVPRALS